VSDKSSAAGGGVGLGSLLFLVFLTLKLCGVIDWSWWWVTCPLWGPIAFALGILAIVAIPCGLYLMFSGRR